VTTFTTEDRLNAMLDLEPIPFAGMVDVSEKGMSQRDVADVLCISRAAVGSIEQEAFRKIRQELFKRGIEKEDLL